MAEMDTKKKYCQPVCEIVRFGIEDIVATSVEDPTDWYVGIEDI